MSDPSTKNITRAEFAGNNNQVRIGGDTNKEFLNSVKRNARHREDSHSHSQTIHATDSSPLLISTPPVITKTLINLYPYLLIADKFLSVITWTCNDIWPSVLTVIVYITVVSYLEPLVTYFGHVIVALVFFGYANLDRQIGRTIFSNAALEDILSVMDSVSLKLDILLSPLTTVNRRHLEKLLMTMFLFSPLYMLLTWLFLTVRQVVLLAGLLLLTFHSPWARVSRRLLWKFRFVRLFVFHATGIDLGGLYSKDDGKNLVSSRTQRFFDVVSKKVSLMMKAATADGAPSVQAGINGTDPTDSFHFSNTVTTEKTDNGPVGTQGNDLNINLDKPLRFTYVLYENQRRWLGLGWRPSMLNYERTAWTDEFLNEAPSPENFELPQGDSGMEWRWVDPMWRLDLTNDGAIELQKGESSKDDTINTITTTTTPGEDEGYIYFDNQWKKPSIEETFGKYTRRRRWVRTAELIRVSDIGKNKSESTGRNMTATELIPNHCANTSSVSVSGITVDDDGNDNENRRRRRKRISSEVTTGSYTDLSDENSHSVSSQKDRVVPFNSPKAE